MLISITLSTNAQEENIKKSEEPAVAHTTEVQDNGADRVEAASTVDWRTNPNKCDQTTHYIRADNLKCIIKPTRTQQVNKGCEQYRSLVAQYDWNITTAQNVMFAESGCDTHAVGDTWVIGGLYAPSCGLFQVRTLKGRPSCEQLKKPAVNVAWAHKLYKQRGWQPWSVCNNRIVNCN